MAGTEGRMEITIPRRKEFVRAAKMAACVLSAQLDFTYDRIKDIELAVEEACLGVVVDRAGRCHDDLLLRFWVDKEKVSVNVSPREHGLRKPDARAVPEAPDSEMAVMVLRTVMDEVSVICDREQGTCVTMVKYRTDT